VTQHDPQNAAPKSRRRTAVTVAWAFVIVVVIVLFLGAIATPKFVGVQCRSKQNAAKGLLRTLAVLHDEAAQRVPAGAPVVLDDEAMSALRRREGGSYVVALVRQGELVPVDPTDSQWREQPPSSLPAEVRAAATPDVLGMAIGNIDGDHEIDVWLVRVGGALEVISSDCAR